jgi:hypothetical protein
LIGATIRAAAGAVCQFSRTSWAFHTPSNAERNAKVLLVSQVFRTCF